MMFWISDSYRAQTSGPSGARKRDGEQHSLSRFFEKVDLLYYSAVAALAACVGALLIF